MGNEAAIKRTGRVGMDLLNGNIMKTLLAFSLPIMLANIVQQLYSMVDLAVIGQYMGSIGTVGVSTGSEVMDFLTPVATGFAAAGQVYISQLYGAHDEIRLKKAIGTLITAMLFMSVIFLVGALGVRVYIVDALNCPAEAREQALSYLCISVLGLPFVFSYNTICSILRGIGESKRPLIFVLVAASVNVVLDILFVAVFHWEAAGTALATVFSQIGSFAAAFIFLYKRRDKFGFELKLSYFRIDSETMKIMLKLGIPHILQSLSVRFSLLWCQANINSFGLVASATNSVGNKMQKICTVFVQGVNTGCGAMIGQNLGAKKHDRVKKIVLCTLAMTFTIAAIGSAFALTIPKQMFRIFTNDKQVLEAGVQYMQILCITYFSAAFCGSFQALVTGCGFASFGFVLGMLDGVICRIGLSVLFAYGLNLGVTGFFLGNATARIIPGILGCIYFLSGKWKTHRLLTEQKHHHSHERPENQEGDNQ